MTAEICIDSLAYRGYGVGRDNGKVWFIPFTVPGDLVLAEPVDEKKRFVYGRTVKIISPSEERIPSVCPLFGDCGGCHWQNMPYALQLEWKEKILKETLSRAGTGSCGVTAVHPAPSAWGYRNRIQLRPDREGRPGFVRAGEIKDIVPVKSCPLAEEGVNLRLERIWEEGVTGGSPPDAKFSSGFEIRTTAGDTTEVLPLEESRKEAGDFSQVNREVNLILQKETAACLDEINPEKKDFRILDLYCGDGNLSLPLAVRSAEITGWDGSASAVRRGNEAARKMKSRGAATGTGIEYKTGYLEKNRKKIGKTAAESDILILDPPRRGIKGLEDFIGGLGVEDLIYVSCSPPSLARDLKALESRGYGPEKIVLFDMFPQTYHMETLTRLKKR